MEYACFLEASPGHSAHGLFYGALAIFAIFNLPLFLSSRTVYYLHNAFYIASPGLFLFAMGGFANQYFWPTSTGFANTSIPLLIAVCALAITLFGRSFLDIAPGTMAGRLLKGQAWVSPLPSPYWMQITSNPLTTGGDTILVMIA